ncbi:NLI interacting factor-like phosphatase family protein, putative [Babesia bigemina]|uniref:Mitochondrial import inner membrane translocase subunit TIM50 n=1 Tax=Babesia bigemina TaxID=5866 RepID=A0A061D462_BABBI|nr:NLI interacting factor-like phosphatase family protein, putative [Babesia bigemina]CDR93764.1 NLI interacting factor-like phosphatase family protein, putative [Babesia bigemina]|eukprot:XP_012765950.1 NLI interacting factor-like phosphatase family protein, putative [Babesia bigemina]
MVLAHRELSIRGVGLKSGDDVRLGFFHFKTLLAYCMMATYSVRNSTPPDAYGACAVDMVNGRSDTADMMEKYKLNYEDCYSKTTGVSNAAVENIPTYIPKYLGPDPFASQQQSGDDICLTDVDSSDEIGDYGCDDAVKYADRMCDFDLAHGDICPDDGAGCAAICDASTLTPTSDTDPTNMDEFNESGEESDAVVESASPAAPVSPECMMGLLSRYIDCTPQLHSTSMRLLMTRESVGSADVIPSQVIRYNNTRLVRYEALRDYLEEEPLFKCLKADISELYNPSSTSASPEETDLPKLLVVLDLDETLVHMHERPNDHYDYMVNIVERDECDALEAKEKGYKTDIFGFTVHSTMHVSLRPGVLEFFDYLRSRSSQFTVALYTAGTRQYANAIIHALDPEYKLISPSVRYFRESCEVSSTPQALRGMPANCIGIGNHHRDEPVPPFYLKKNLQVFDWPLSRVVFFDNSLLSFMNNPENGVWIRPWRGAQPFIDDGRVELATEFAPVKRDGRSLPGQDGLYEFTQVVRLLEELVTERDVRESLRRKFTLCNVVARVLGTEVESNKLDVLLKA